MTPRIGFSGRVMQEGAPRRNRQIRRYQTFGMRFGEGKTAFEAPRLSNFERGSGSRGFPTNQAPCPSGGGC
jgi:hypothetical protein